MLLHPATNDVVVKPKRGGCGMYVIRRSAGPDQIQMSGRGAAIAHALARDFRNAGPITPMVTARGLRTVPI